jgi:hypothetical protein
MRPQDLHQDVQRFARCRFRQHDKIIGNQVGAVGDVHAVIADFVDNLRHRPPFIQMLGNLLGPGSKWEQHYE